MKGYAQNIEIISNFYSSKIIFSKIDVYSLIVVMIIKQKLKWEVIRKNSSNLM